jgi:hypothetical protein
VPIFFPGKTRCPLCERVIERDDARVSFPPFLRRTHSLGSLSDATVHQACFETWEHREVFLQLLERFRELLGTKPKDVSWREGETWMAQRGEEFDLEAASLDPRRPAKNEG